MSTGNYQVTYKVKKEMISFRYSKKIKLRLFLPLFGLCVLSSAFADDLYKAKEIMEHAVSFCNKFRAERNPDLKLPPEFDHYLLKTVEKMKAEHEIPSDTLKMLETDAHHLIEKKELTLYNWNVFHLNIILHSTNEKLVQFNLGNYTNGNFEHLHAHLENLHRQRKPGPNSSRATFREKLSPNVNSGYCPIALHQELGIGDMNLAWAGFTPPFGVETHSKNIAHETVMNQEYFFMHDTNHSLYLVGEVRNELGLPSDSPIDTPLLEIPPEKLSQYITREMNLIKKIDSIADPELKHQLHVVQFLFKHELNFTSKEILEACGKDVSQLSSSLIVDYRFEGLNKVTDINTILPPHLQGDWSKIKKYVSEQNLINNQTIIHNDNIVSDEKKKAIRSYLGAAFSEYCKLRASDGGNAPSLPSVIESDNRNKTLEQQTLPAYSPASTEENKAGGAAH